MLASMSSAMRSTTRTATRQSSRAFSALCKGAVRAQAPRSTNLTMTAARSINSVSAVQGRHGLLSASSAQGKRFYTVVENGLAAPVIDYNKMNAIVEDGGENDSNYVIVDVREPDEFSAGHIPNAINLPCKSSPGALGLDPEEFKLTFGFDKPSKDKTLVFYCLAGVRATISEELAGTFDYEHRLNYVGSFKDWIDHNGKIAVPQPEAEEEKEKKKN